MAPGSGSDYFCTFGLVAEKDYQKKTTKKKQSTVTATPVRAAVDSVSCRKGFFIAIWTHTGKWKKKTTQETGSYFLWWHFLWNSRSNRCYLFPLYPEAPTWNMHSMAMQKYLTQLPRQVKVAATQKQLLCYGLKCFFLHGSILYPPTVPTNADFVEPLDLFLKVADVVKMHLRRDWQEKDESLQNHDGDSRDRWWEECIYSAI